LTRRAIERHARRVIALAGVALASALVLASPAAAATATLNTWVTMSDGVGLSATVTGQAPLAPRPVIVEFSPYGPATGTADDGADYNYLLVQDRGTGQSPGGWDALGPRSQEDVQQTLQWACHQPWSDGELALNGFSASAIVVYNSLHLPLPCVRTAVLKSGTFSLYRDLLYPGGINNFVPGAGVLAIIGGQALAQGPSRLQSNPISGLLAGLATGAALLGDGLSDLAHPTLDSFWTARQYQGDANRFPILMLDSFYDVESQGAFEAFRALRGVGDRLLVLAGHDGAPAGTDGGAAAVKAWLAHYLLAVENGTETQPRVQLWMSSGSRESYEAGRFVRATAGDWPVPGTRWISLALSAGGGAAGQGGSLVARAPRLAGTQSYAAIPALPTVGDVPNTAFLGPDGLDQAAAALPLLTETNLGEPLGLSYSTPPLGAALLAAGPAALDVRLSSTAAQTDLWAVICDVWPDGSSHPVASGRLDSAFPGIEPGASITGGHGEVVGPYGDFSTPAATPPGVTRTYQLAFWPIGNQFKAGHRIRLVILGASAASLPRAPAINSVHLGGPGGSRLLLPVLPSVSPRR
jgi:predicted acyl esterase